MAQRLNRNMFDYVHDIKAGQWFGPAAYRSDRLRGVLAVPEIGPPWWNVERCAPAWSAALRVSTAAGSASKSSVKL